MLLTAGGAGAYLQGMSEHIEYDAFGRPTWTENDSFVVGPVGTHRFHITECHGTDANGSPVEDPSEHATLRAALPPVNDWKEIAINLVLENARLKAELRRVRETVRAELAEELFDELHSALYDLEEEL